MRGFALGTAVLAGAMVLSSPVHAQARVVGSASFATQRSCSAVTSAQACDGGGPGQFIANSQYGGGVGVGGLNDFRPQPDNFAWSDVRFTGPSDLAVIRAATQAGGDVRMNINAFAFQTYTYTGPTGGRISVTGALHIVDSSTSPSGGAFPNGAIFSDYVAVWDPAAIAGLTTPQQLFNALFYAPCGTPGVLGAAIGGGTLGGGDFTARSTTVACAPGSLNLTTGQKVLVVNGLQLPVNRGGFADASATYRALFGDDLTPEETSLLTTSLASAISEGAVVTGVPEPTSWAMLIAGFGLVGAIQRRRKTAFAG